MVVNVAVRIRVLARHRYNMDLRVTVTLSYPTVLAAGPAIRCPAVRVVRLLHMPCSV